MINDIKLNGNFIIEEKSDLSKLSTNFLNVLIFSIAYDRYLQPSEPKSLLKNINKNIKKNEYKIIKLKVKRTH